MALSHYCNNIILAYSVTAFVCDCIMPLLLNCDITILHYCIMAIMLYQTFGALYYLVGQRGV